MKRIALTALAVAAFICYGYHEGSWGNNQETTLLGVDAGSGASSSKMVAVGWKAAANADASYNSTFIGDETGRNTVRSKNVVGVGHSALGDAKDLKNVVALGNYELAAIEGVTNTTSINGGQIFVSQTYDVAMLRTDFNRAPTNSPFCYMGGNTYIGGTGTTYIAGNVVFNGRSAVIDNSSYISGGSGTAKLAGSGDLANMNNIPFSSGDCFVFVSANGSDYGDGTAISPYLTINRALRDLIDSPSNNKKMGVFAGEYAYPSNALLRSAASLGITIIGLEGAAKTSFSLAASGVDYAAATNSASTINAFNDKAVLNGSENKWLRVYGFTLNGRTLATKSYSDGSYSDCWFTACRFTGKDAVRWETGRRFNRMCCANCVFEDCLFDEDFEVNVSDYGGSETCPYWYGNIFFACSFVNTIVRAPKKYTQGTYGSKSACFFCDCEFINSLVLDTKNKWRYILENSVVNWPIEDSAIAVKETADHAVWYEHAHDCPEVVNRSIVSVGQNLNQGSRPWGDKTKDTFCCHYTNLYNYVDANIYPLDGAFELFGIGYNNSLTRRFKEYLLEHNYQTKDNIGLIDKRNQNATIVLAENDDLNIYSLTTTDNTRPMLAMFMMAATSAATPTDRIVSTSLAQNESDWTSHRVDKPTPNKRSAPTNPDDND